MRLPTVFLKRWASTIIGFDIGLLCAFLLILYSEDTRLTELVEIQQSLYRTVFGSDASSKLDPSFVKAVFRPPEVRDPKSIRSPTVIGGMAQDLRVFCIILTGAIYHTTRSVAAKHSYVKRCDGYVFISTVEVPELPTLKIKGIPATDGGRDWAWGKIRGALKYVHDHYIDDLDWVLRIDDDAYGILENFREMVYDYSPSEAHHLGVRVKPFVKGGYNQGGAYALSRGAVRKLVSIAFKNDTLCPPGPYGIAEDVFITWCFRSFGVYPPNTTDDAGGHKFLLEGPWHFAAPLDVLSNWWIADWPSEPMLRGQECCSNEAAVFHHVDPGWTFLLEFILYNINPRQLHNSSVHQETPRKRRTKRRGFLAQIKN